MTRLLARGVTLVLLAALVWQSSAAAEEPGRTAPFAPLYTYLTAEDYPAEAIANREQGTVAFRLSIGADGRVNGCTITASSGSTILDATSCRIMVTRARFRPASNASGKPVEDSFEGRITWRIPEGDPQRVELPPRVNSAIGLWYACTSGETAKLVLTSLPASEVAQGAFRACRALEDWIASEVARAGINGLTPSLMIPKLREDVLAKLPAFLAKARANLSQ